MPSRPQHWLPGLVAGQGLIDSSGVAWTLDYGEIYPFGLLAQVSVRFRGPLSLEQQREIGTQSESYLRNRPASGPQLTLEQEGKEGIPGEIVTHEGHDALWTITYWFEQTVAPSALSLNFNWAEQRLESNFAVSAEQSSRALDEATELWSASAEGYFSA